MTKNPFINATAALVYIAVVASIIFSGPELGIELPVILAISGFLSLFVFSAGMMGYIFLSEPIQLFLSDKKKEGVSLFLKTLLVFGCLVFTLALIALLLNTFL